MYINTKRINLFTLWLFGAFLEGWTNTDIYGFSFFCYMLIRLEALCITVQNIDMTITFIPIYTMQSKLQFATMKNSNYFHIFPFYQANQS